MTTSERFYSKIMLFGEYGVLLGSRALTIPYTHFMGELSFVYDEKYTDTHFALASHKQLESYFEAIKKEVSIRSILNFSAIEKDMENGLYFESSIPQGYGIGSSGALVAALYHRYALEPVPAERGLDAKEISVLKRTFSVMESFFHGKSSGIDPLIAYLKYPLLIMPGENIVPAGIPRQKFEGQAAIFLIDSGITGKTQTYVEAFLEKCKIPSYSDLIRENYIPLVNRCIDTLLNGEARPFFEELKKLSEFQWEHFAGMIPQGFQNAWEKGNEGGHYHLKLCGSGGGGFILAFTQDYASAEKQLASQGMTCIPVYYAHSAKAQGENKPRIDILLPLKNEL